MNSIDVVFDYHERTKHQFQRYANAPGTMDWATQPNPFRWYDGAQTTNLGFPESDLSPDYSSLDYEAFFAGQWVKVKPINKDSISAFFYFSLALSAWKRFQAESWSLRVNPSSGNLHPTEAYLIADALPGLSTTPAIYHYLPLFHRLECRAQLEPLNWQVLTQGLANGGQLPSECFLLGLCSIHWRESWKYGERGYRYSQHDCGQSMATVVLRIAAAMMGWQLTLLDGICDQDLARLIGIDRDQDFPDQQEREAADLLVVVTPGETAIAANWKPGPDAVELVSSANWQGKANQLSPDHQPWPWIDKVALACNKADNEIEPVCSKTKSRQQTAQKPSATAPIPNTEHVAGFSLGRVIRQRRSALNFDNKTSITKQAFYQILSHTLPRTNPQLFAVTDWPARVHLGLFVHRVAQLPSGLYLLVRDPEKKQQLQQLMNNNFHWRKPADCPLGLDLYCLLPADAREAAMELSCHQEIAASGVFSCAMLAEFEQPIRDLGCWWYRRLFWETGMIGQMLYLEAEAKNIRATGIGCFFDDPVHQLFGLQDRSYQSLYHFTMGNPIDDSRLQTLPAYHFLDD